MVKGKIEDQSYCQGELGGQHGVMCVIKTLRQSSIQPKAVKSWWKQAGLISRLSDAYQSIDSSMSLVHVYGHQNSSKLESTLTPLASLNIRLGSLSKQIMAPFLISPATRNTLAVGFSYPYVLPIVSICRVSVHSNLAHFAVYKISKRW